MGTFFLLFIPLILAWIIMRWHVDGIGRYWAWWRAKRDDPEDDDGGFDGDDYEPLPPPPDGGGIKLEYEKEEVPM